MRSRKKKLLCAIIEEHIKSATPVASGFLADNFKLSPATIRNEMAGLEKAGYLNQPHTSAGRVPTESAYNFYLENCKEFKLSKSDQEVLKTSVQSKIFPQKELAKSLAELSGEAVILAFSSKDIYYTGLSNLFAKPEFCNQNLVCRIGEVVDQLDEKIDEIFDEVKKEVKILIGKKNPFGDNCSAVISQYQDKKKKKGIVAILGPMRMNYTKNIALIKYSKDLLEKMTTQLSS